MNRTDIRTFPVPLIAVIGLVFASCGGSSGTADEQPDTIEPATTEAPSVTDPDSPTETPPTEPPATDTPPATEPPATDAPPATDFVLGADMVLIDFANGYVRMDIWPDWEVANEMATVSAFFATEEDPWEIDFETLDQVVSVISPSGDELTFVREQRYNAVSYDEWRDALALLLTGAGDLGAAEILDQGPASWAGLDGDFFTIETDALPLTLHTAEVDDHLVAAFSTGEGDTLDQVDAMLANARFEPSVAGLLAHSHDMEFRSTAAGPEIAVSVLTPFEWEQVTDSESLEFRDPLTGSNASITLTPSQGGIEAMVDLIASTDLLSGDPERQDNTSNGLDYAVLWDGPARDANKAIIVADDGAYGVAILVETAVALVGGGKFGDRLIDQIVDTVFFLEHSQV